MSRVFSECVRTGVPNGYGVWFRGGLMPSQARKCETRCVGVWCSGWTVIFWIYIFCIIRGWILPRLLPGRRFCDFRWEEVWFFFLWGNPDCKHTSKWLQPSAFILAASTLPLAPILRWFCRLVWYYRSFSTQGWLLFMQCKMVFFFGFTVGWKRRQEKMEITIITH